MVQPALRCGVLVIAALSLGASFAHVLEALPRLTVWSPELWRQATVFNGQYQVFGWLGGPLDIGAILLAGILAFTLRRERPAFWFALIGALLFAVSLTMWLSVVAPANAILATWQPGPLPEDFFVIRNRWEFGHIVIASLKLVGFITLVLSVLQCPQTGESRPDGRIF
ncbi:DUF1772 domain-containing protein [Microvirga puerhi]|uniref:DUF1772 domain-containing protein n=1 Tax=Microvirga puerhi TaxID=2876078 RepID=A0ABS7VN14_9HYPH|nr:DUF1772 domain-containing protein [Microvirga puerhi]MBZ6076392.1 DUF1772 domain-containing protein [Microvirga puerhi]